MYLPFTIALVSVNKIVLFHQSLLVLIFSRLYVRYGGVTEQAAAGEEVSALRGKAAMTRFGAILAVWWRDRLFVHHRVRQGREGEGFQLTSRRWPGAEETSCSRTSNLRSDVVLLRATCRVLLGLMKVSDQR